MKAPTFLIRGCGVIVLALAALWAGPAWAANCTSTSDGTWEQSGGTATWDCGTPGTTDSVIIAHNIVVADDIQVAGLTIQIVGTLQGDSSFTLAVSGDWNNQGNFIHNDMDVDLNLAGVGTQTISGNTTFDRLELTGADSIKDFSDSLITITDRLQHTAGSMQRGTSTFIFDNGADLGGSGVKQFFNLIINSAGVGHQVATSEFQAISLSTMAPLWASLELEPHCESFDLMVTILKPSHFSETVLLPLIT
ncbi:MAG: hypothetical protein R2873_21545 [Caldilineaceae bacterium]